MAQDGLDSPNELVSVRDDDRLLESLVRFSWYQCVGTFTTANSRMTLWIHWNFFECKVGPVCFNFSSRIVVEIFLRQVLNSNSYITGGLKYWKPYWVCDGNVCDQGTEEEDFVGCTCWNVPWATFFKHICLSCGTYFKTQRKKWVVCQKEWFGLHSCVDSPTVLSCPYTWSWTTVWCQSEISDSKNHFCSIIFDTYEPGLVHSFRMEQVAKLLYWRQIHILSELRLCR